MQTVLKFRTNWLLFFLEELIRYQLLKGCNHIWNLGAARFPLHQGPITDALPPRHGTWCDGSRSACGYALPCLAPFALHDEDTYWSLQRRICRFSLNLGIFVDFGVFHLIFSQYFSPEAARGPSVINCFS